MPIMEDGEWRQATFDEVMAEAQQLADMHEEPIAAYYDQGSVGLYILSEYKGRTVEVRFMNAARDHAIGLLDGFLDIGTADMWTKKDIQHGLDIVNSEEAGWKRIKGLKHVPYQTLDDLARAEINEGQLRLFLPRN